ncbi:MAG: hypothetical protein AAGF89_10015, partial [Bacteroidota bacterium]
LNRITFSGETDCGIQNLRINFQRFGRLLADVTYRPEDCSGRSDLQSGSIPISLERIPLSEFIPLVNRLELEQIGQTVTF